MSMSIRFRNPIISFVAAFSARSRLHASITGEAITKQSFKDECDINKILSRYQRTGVIDFVAKHAPRFGDATAPDFQEALNTVIRGQAVFDDLPSSLRKRFSNSPVEFLSFLEDPSNDEEAIRLGLKVAVPAAAVPSEPPVAASATAAAASAAP